MLGSLEAQSSQATISKTPPKVGQRPETDAAEQIALPIHGPAGKVGKQTQEILVFFFFLLMLEDANIFSLFILILIQ